MVSPRSSAWLSSRRVSAIRSAKRRPCSSTASTTSSTSSAAPVVDLDQHLVLELQRGLDLLVQDLLVQHVRDPDADARDLVLVGRADAAAGGADLGLAQEPLGDLVDGHVVRHDQVRVGADQQAGWCRRRGASSPASSSSSTPGSTTTPLPITLLHAGGEDPGRDEVQGEVLPVGQHHGVPGVVAALVAHHPLHVARRAGRSPCPCPRRPTGRRSARSPACETPVLGFYGAPVRRGAGREG